MLNFHGLELRYGYVMAYELLLQIEKAARIASWSLFAVDPEIRLANALRVQDAMAAAQSSIQIAA